MLAASRRSENESLSDVAYRKIKEKIVSLALPPASLVEEATLAAELEIGLTPVRQALRRLAMESFVVILPRRGTIVADLNLSDLQKIFELRLELEALATRYAAQRATPTQIAEMERLIAESTQPHHVGDTNGTSPHHGTHSADNRTLMDADRAIHSLIAAAAHNDFLAETLERLYSHVLRLWYLSIEQVSSLDEAMQEHAAIIAAIKSGDEAQAASIMRQHVCHFQQEFLRTIS